MTSASRKGKEVKAMKPRKSGRDPRRESGQVLVLTAVSIIGLLAMAAFVIDVGAAYRVHRRAQAAADASALAAAQVLPDTATATQISNGKAAQNLPDGTVTPTYSQTYAANDTVTATATASTPSFFAKVVGIQKFNAKATATALIGSYLGWAGDIAPWTTDVGHMAFGQSFTFKVDQGNQPAPGNFGNVSLPIKENGCALGQGQDYKQLVANSEHSCLVQTGDWINASGSTGNKTGQTQQGLQARGAIQGFNPYSILTSQPDGSYVLTDYNNPNVVVIPVIQSFGNGGSSQYQVIGFAWFIITDWTNKTVTGMFIDSRAPSAAVCPTPTNPNAGCPVGGFTPYGFKVIQLVR
jgi:Flp pilus assembly protein TadG